MKKCIPNLITLLNLFCGCIAILMAFENRLLLAGLFVGLGIFFDFFDGLAARVLKVSSELGKQLDSLADMVTSGVVPGLVMYQMISTITLTNLSLDSENVVSTAGDLWFQHPYIPLIGFLITLGSCYRLGKFNIDTRQSDSFIGLPTPANAILIISLGIVQQTTEVDWLYGLLHNIYFLIGLTILSCYLLNAELPLFALKFKNLKFKGNEIRFLFILLCIVMIVFFQLYAIPCIILLYILMSVINNMLISKAKTT